MALTAFVGEDYSFNMGNLKTYTMTLFTLLDYNNGRNIYSNYSLNGIDYEHIFSLRHLIEKLPYMIDCTISIDELGAWWDCYSNPKKKDGTSDFKNFSRQVRKRNVKLNYTAQSFYDIPRTLRKVTQYVYRTAKYHKDGKKCELGDCLKEHVLELTPLYPSRDGYLIGDSIYYPVIENIFNIYDTNEMIGLCSIEQE